MTTMKHASDTYIRADRFVPTPDGEYFGIVATTEQLPGLRACLREWVRQIEDRQRLIADAELARNMQQRTPDHGA